MFTETPPGIGNRHDMLKRFHREKGSNRYFLNELLRGLKPMPTHLQALLINEFSEDHGEILDQYLLDYFDGKV